MNNRAIKRIFKKNLGVSSKEELAEVLAPLDQGIRDNFIDVIDQLDQGFSDQEKVIEIRDRSLAISSKEMQVLNDEILQAGERQKSVIDRLKSMLVVLSETGLKAVGDDDKLEDIITSVQNLIESQVRSAKSLRVLFEEGRKVGSALNYPSLQSSVRRAVESLGGISPKVCLALSGKLLGWPQPEEFVCIDDEGKPTQVWQESSNRRTRTRAFLIESTKNDFPLAKLVVEVENIGESTEHLMAQIMALIPNIATTIQNINLLKEEKMKDHLANELKTARFVQQALLPPSHPLKLQGMDIHGYYESASECGGDWWSSIHLEDDRQLILLGDVTGHGTASAMISAVVKGYCDSLIRRPGLRPSDILRELNVVVYRMAKDSRRAMTMAALIIDPSKNEILYSNAGHPHPIILGTTGDSSVRYLLGYGNILGLEPDSDYTDKTFKYSTGELVVLYSDGLTEAINDQNELYGDRRLFRLLKKLDSNQPAQKINEAILGDRILFSNGRMLNDDITSVVVKTS